MNQTETQKAVANLELNDLSQLPAKVYKFRVLGMSLGGIAIAAVLYENHVPMVYWLWWFFSCFVWPHFAFQFAKRQPKPYLAERNNLLFDSFVAGSWASLMWFNLLPAVLLLVISTADKANSGIKNLWLYSQPVLLLGLILGFFITGFEFQPVTSMFVILASLPVMIVHTSFVSLSSYKLIRRVQGQNRLLKELNQKDTLTQLYNRRHWKQEVDKLLLQSDQHSSLSLILIDIDHFKQFNDKHGHSIGDEILLAIAGVISNVTPDNALSGRLGGDEFAVVLQNNLKAARTVAEQICKQVAELHISHIDQLNCTVSIGMSEQNDSENSFRSWFDSADKNLYQAKNAGRNQIC